MKTCSYTKGFFSPEKIISNNPKISIITPVYNSGKYLLRFLRSIQYQNFNDIEIILIDDKSIDNSIELIKQYQIEDKRINLIENKKIRGTFSSRIMGILKSKGDYIIIPDSDDILLEDSLKYFYNFSIKYNYDFLRFNLYLNYGLTLYDFIAKHLESRPIYQPELSTYIFYGLGYLRQLDFNISNKFIKRETLIKTINLFGKSNLNLYMIAHEDGLLNYLLYRTAKSAYYIKKFGYYYIKNNSIKKRYKSFVDIIKFRFLFIIYVFIFSKNTKYEKDMTNNLFNRLIYNRKLQDKSISLLKCKQLFFINIIKI